MTCHCQIYQCFRLVEAIFPRATTNPNYYPDLGGASSYQHGISALDPQIGVITGEKPMVASRNDSCYLRLGSLCLFRLLRKVKSIAKREKLLFSHAIRLAL